LRRAAGLLTRRPAAFSAKIAPRLTPERVRALMLQLGRDLRRAS
jgi:uncharacterized protein YneF (UPF0154 family)